MTTLVITQRLRSFSSGCFYGPGTLVNTRMPVSDQAGSVGDVDNRPSGGPFRSIRKNSVLPGSGPTDLH
jgi:hypothetical protein